jgi:antitoxin component of MazEF toxin-antitoxin module
MPILVERSLFKIGDSMAVTLPKGWVRYYRLRPGDLVEITANDEIVIRVKELKEKFIFDTK